MDPSGLRAGPRRGVVIALLLAAVCLLSGGCSVVELRSGNNAPGSVLDGNRLSFDLTTRPTRADVGMTGDKNFKAYQRDEEDFAVTVQLPTGTLQIPARIVSIDTDGAGGVDAYGDGPREPKFFSINRKFAPGENVTASLLADAPLLGLDPADITRVTPGLSASGNAPVPQAGVLYGFVDDWLSAQVQLRSFADSVQVLYEFEVDVYHNPAIDRVLVDGRMPLDLTHPPDREALAFLPGYRDAYVNTRPGDVFTIDVTLPTGRLTVTADGLSARATGPDGPPISAEVYENGTEAQTRQRLDAAATVLGIDPAEVTATLTPSTSGAPNPWGSQASFGERVQRSWDRPVAPGVSIDVRVDMTLGRADEFAGSIRYQLAFG
ncbi:hypothetical protein GB931_12610 [Modestobacter sp. I12A-02628]|uniref:hypothetical protein n=1 Tax=Goekera deserti TaxID=2497753 RepID=UPI00128D07DF|nr:hypothetical protein [Goekera deserti]MPQ98746.1 hypothetical protein [Goekera deserti]